MKSSNARAMSALILTSLLAEQGSLSTLLKELPASRDESLIREICFGSCRFYAELSFLVGELVNKPLRKKDADIANLLVIGLYQLRHLRIPEHAIVNETVAAATALGKSWAGPLVNAVLRNYLKRREALQQQLAGAGPEVRYSHPAWLLARLQTDWPDCWEQILEANNQRPPMTLRVNLARIPRTAYLETLQAAGIRARPGFLANSAVYLEKATSVENIPGFAAGLSSVQDEASQLIPPLLALEPGLRVLDACAAPGGKTSHILESEQSLTSLLALDSSASRLVGLEENLRRLGLTAEVCCGDASEPAAWWSGTRFDRILLDAPCSATGVIRRHPDIKLLRREKDLASLQARQISLLSALWPCLAPGGRLLYTTCSVLRLENDDVIAAFLEQKPDAKNAAITADWGVECRFGRQLLPDRQGSDGFYFCRLLKS